MDADVTTVLFDLDETLCEPRRSSSAVLAEAFEAAGVEPFFTADDYHERTARIGGTGSDVRRREWCFEELAREHGRDRAVGRRVADAYEELRDYTDVRFLPDAEEILAAMDGEYALGLVTNGGPDTQSPKVDALGLDDLFDTVVLAGHDAPAKPDPEPFRRAAADLDAALEGTIHVGNSLASDVAGANAAGIGSVWIPYGGYVDASTEVDPDHTLESIRDLRTPPWEG